METKVYSQSGKETSSLSLPENLFGQEWNAAFMRDVVLAYNANARAGTAQVKDRGAVKGTGKKPWRQKGTGRARHGDRQSPIWVGGGVAHGPTNEKDYSQKINKNARAKAFAQTLSKKFADNAFVFVDAITFAEPKTKDARAVIDALSAAIKNEELATRRKHAAVVILPERSISIEKSFANFGNIEVAQAKDVNVVDLLTNRFAIVVNPEAVLEVFAKRGVTKAARSEA